MTSTDLEPDGALYRALAAAQAEMPTVAKSKTAKVPTKAGGSYSYSYADLADVMTAVAPVLSKHGLAVTTTTARLENVGWIIEGRLTHEAGAYISARLPASFTGGPQQVGSELTYARRYLLGMLTGVVTDDDDDGQAAQHAPQRQAPQAVISKPAPPRVTPMDGMVAAMTEAGVETDQMLDYARAVTGRDDLTSAADLTEDEIRAVTRSAILRVTPEMIGRERRQATAEAEGKAS